MIRKGGEKTIVSFLQPLSQRVTDYLPPKEILAIKPTILDKEKQDSYRKTRPQDAFALVAYNDRLCIVPAWHPLNGTSKTANASQYGTGSMESLSLEPIIKDNKIVGGNIILLEPRLDRLFKKALPARNITFSIKKPLFRQGIIDLMAILGKKIMTSEDGTIGRGSIRVFIGPGMGKFGKSAAGQSIDAVVEGYYWAPYFPQRAYTNEGLIVGAGPYQRFVEFHGKHASQYGDGVRIGDEAKHVGADEAIILAPFQARAPQKNSVLSQYKDKTKQLQKAMMHLALADGLGEELLAVRKDGTVLLPPMTVNRLGGTTADYILRYIAPYLGIPAKESFFSLDEVLSGKIQGLFVAGNAARIASIGKVIIYDFNLKPFKKISLKVPKSVLKIMEQYEKEVHGQTPVLHKSLITSIDLVDGEKARKILEKVYSTWL